MAAQCSKPDTQINRCDCPPSRKLLVVLGLILVAVTCAAHFPATGAGFTWDDDVFLTKCPLVLDSDGLYKSWFTMEGTDYWPLMTSMFWFEWRIWGDNPSPFHAVNIALHAVAVVLLWRVLRHLNINGPGAFLAALIFAIHPVTVESVAWIAERKNVLSIVFYLLAIMAYLRFEDHNRSRWYAIAIIMALAALLAKSSAVVLPMVLLLLAWWRRGRLTRKDVLCTLPFFAMSLVLGLVEMSFVRNQIAPGDIGRFEGFASRIAAVGWIVWFYLYKLVVPIDLVMVYPRWNVDGGNVLSYVPLLLLVASFTTLWVYRRNWGRAPLAAIGYFLVVLLPVVGLLNMQYNRYSLVADHLQYLAMPGIFALVGGGLGAAWSWARQTHKTGVVVGLACLVGMAASTLGVLTWRQASLYRDDVALWSHTLASNKRCWAAYNHRGNAYDTKGDYDLAIQDYTKAIELKPNFAIAYMNRGNTYSKMGDYGRQILDCTRAIEIHSAYAEAYHNRSVAYNKKGAYDLAIQDCNKTISLKPANAEAYFCRGSAYGKKGNNDQEIKDYSRAIELKPDYAKAYNNRGSAFGARQDYARAFQDFNKAIELKPDYAEAYLNRAVSYFTMRSYDQAWLDVKKCKMLGKTPHPAFIEALSKASGRSE